MERHREAVVQAESQLPRVDLVMRQPGAGIAVKEAKKPSVLRTEQAPPDAGIQRSPAECAGPSSIGMFRMLHFLDRLGGVQTRGDRAHAATSRQGFWRCFAAALNRDRGVFGGPVDEARVRAYWDSMSPSYAPGIDHGLVRFTHGLQHDAVLRLASPRRGERVLDAGAGSGLLSRRLVAAGCVVTAVDSSAAMVEQLRGVTPFVVLAKLEELELVGEPFDHVLAIGVLNFVTDPGGIMRRLCGLVRPGGTLVVQVTEWSIFGLVYWLNYRARGFQPFLFSSQWLMDQAAEQGLKPAGYEHPLPHDLTIVFKRAPA